MELQALYLLTDGRIIRKVPWDTLWHVCYRKAGWGDKDSLSWDRISEAKAAELLRQQRGLPLLEIVDTH